MLKLNQKGALDPIVIVLLILVLAMGGYIGWTLISSDKEEVSVANSDASQSESSENNTTNESREETPEEVDSRLTYTAEKYGISFKYPNNEKLKLTERDADGSSLMGEYKYVSLKYDCGSNCGLVFTLNVLKTDDSVSLERTKEQFKENSTYTLSEEKTQQAGSANLTKLTFTPQGTPNIDEIIYAFSSYNGYFYYITINDNGAVAPVADDFDITGAGTEILDSLVISQI